MELAEAQVKDYMTLKRDVDSIKGTVAQILTQQAVQDKKTDLIIQRLNSPVEQERIEAIFWQQIKGMLSTTTGKIFLLLAVGCIGLAGQRILELLKIIPQG